MEAELEVRPDVGLRRPGREALLVAAYGLAWFLGNYVSTYYWFLPAGLRFACLWWVPRRLWVWLALAEFMAILGIVLQTEGYRTWLGFVLGVFVPFGVHATVVTIAQRGAEQRLPNTPWRMARLLLAMLAAASFTAAILTMMSRLESQSVIDDPMVHLIAFAIGDFIAMLIVVPIWLHLVSTAGRLDRRLFIDLLLFFVPLLVLLSVIPTLRPQAVIYAGVLALIPMLFMVFRHGWEGGGWALALTSIAVYTLGEVFDNEVARELMQLFLAIVGAVSLMLGAAVRALRQARDALAERNATLAAQALEMRTLGERLVRAQEDEQRRVALELQGELEQGMTALGTRLGLLARTHLEPAQMAAIDSLRGLTQEIHASMRDALLRLRPLLLDRQGLEQTLRSGPIRDLLADAGVRYTFTLHGDAARLDPDVQGALYRICQEGAIDCVRRARGRRFEIALDVGEGVAPEAVLCVVYDGDVGPAGRDRVLPVTRDRVLALGGEYHADVRPAGLEHRIRLPGMTRS